MFARQVARRSSAAREIKFDSTASNRRDINCSTHVTQWNLWTISEPGGSWNDSTKRRGAYEVRDLHTDIVRVHHWEWTDWPLRDSSDVRPFEWRLAAIRKINHPVFLFLSPHLPPRSLPSYEPSLALGCSRKRANELVRLDFVDFHEQ